jgi:DNA polymerase III delta subunit
MARRSTAPGAPAVGAAARASALLRRLSVAEIPAAWAKDRPRVIVLAGAESAFREEALAALKRLLFGDSDGGLSWIVLHGPAASAPESDSERLAPAKVLDEVRTRSLFAAPDEPKAVIVRQAEGLLLRHPSGDPKRSPKGYEVFENRLDSLPRWAVLVFEVPQPGVLENTRFGKAVAAAGGWVDCRPPAKAFGQTEAAGPLAFELRRRAAELHLELDGPTAAALIERTGRDLALLSEELEKLALALNAGPQRRARVSGAEIAAHCARSRLVSGFEFSEALGERDLKRALETLEGIFSRGLADSRRPGRVISNESQIAVILLGAVYMNFSRLQDVNAAREQGLNERAAFEAAKVPYPFQDSVRRALAKHSPVSLRRAQEALFRANLDLRTGHGAREALEKLAWSVCRDAAAE